jgi:hypothetical protein
VPLVYAAGDPLHDPEGAGLHSTLSDRGPWFSVSPGASGRGCVRCEGVPLFHLALQDLAKDPFCPNPDSLLNETQKGDKNTVVNLLSAAQIETDKARFREAEQKSVAPLDRELGPLGQGPCESMPQLVCCHGSWSSVRLRLPSRLAKGVCLAGRLGLGCLRDRSGSVCQANVAGPCASTRRPAACGFLRLHVAPGTAEAEVRKAFWQEAFNPTAPADPPVVPSSSESSGSLGDRGVVATFAGKSSVMAPVPDGSASRLFWLAHRVLGWLTDLSARCPHQHGVGATSLWLRASPSGPAGLQDCRPHPPPRFRAWASGHRLGRSSDVFGRPTTQGASQHHFRPCAQSGRQGLSLPSSPRHHQTPRYSPQCVVSPWPSVPASAPLPAWLLQGEATDAW